MFPLGLRLTILFVAGMWLGSLVNWAIYSLAWNPRPISPWGRAPVGVPPRGWLDRIPVSGWLTLNREAILHGRWFWVRPLLIELGTGLAVAALYWWEVVQLGLVRGQLPASLAVPLMPLHLEFFSHLLLLGLMLTASFIDIDEKIIPDEITVPGTVLGLALATILPISLLPQVAERAIPPMVGAELGVVNGNTWWLEPVTAIAPHNWPPYWGEAGNWQSLLIALGCYWLWCFALTPRIWRGRHGVARALRLIEARVQRELLRPPLRELLIVGTLAIFVMWVFRDNGPWTGLLTALIGLASSGGIVWAVRLIGTAALRREAMGFGDVTLMMMIGTFLGWQAGLILFFLAPFAGLVIGLIQLILRRDDVIPYGPFLCLAAAACVVCWAPVWMWAQPIFGMGWLVPAVLVVCLVLLGVMLAIWQVIKGLLLGGVA